MRGWWIVAIALGLPCAAGAAEPAEDVFQRAIQAYQAGDRSGAFRLFQSAATAGNSKAAVQTGWAHEFGAGVPRNLAEAARWYRKSAEQGDPDGQAALARACAFGVGVPQSRRDAIHWDRLAARQGHAESACYARWLSDPPDNIGFRNVEERNLVIGYRMVDMVVHNEPVGRVFRNFRERIECLVGVARRLEADMAYARWWRARGDFDRCRATRRSGCTDPGPEPR